MAKKEVIWPFFLISLFFSLTAYLPLITFAPFLALSYYRFTLLGALWVAAGCGLIIDLLSSTPLGMYTLNYVFVSFLLYRYRIHFVEKPLGLASLTLIFSICSLLITRVFFFIYGISLPFTFKGLVTDFLILPIGDGLYSFFCFSLPLILYRFLRRQWFHFLFFRKETKKKEEEELKRHVK